MVVIIIALKWAKIYFRALQVSENVNLLSFFGLRILIQKHPPKRY